MPHSDLQPLTLSASGAQLFPAVLDPSGVERASAALAIAGQERAGVRLRAPPALEWLLGPQGLVGGMVAGILGSDAAPVRAVLFDKSAGLNWALGWHQDRTIVVKERVEVEGYGPWSTKGGLQHVEPPFRIIEGMLTARVHLDPVDDRNAPLLIAPGSHREGRVPQHAILDVVARCGTFSCEAQAGDVWLYSTAIVHASAAAEEPRRRRVLQVDYASTALDSGLEWLGVSLSPAAGRASAGGPR